MAQPSIHDISADDFKALTYGKAVDFLAAVVTAWLPKSGNVSVDTEIALPDSYQVMVDRRLRQLAKRTDTEVDEVLADVLRAAVALRDEALASGELVAV